MSRERERERGEARGGTERVENRAGRSGLQSPGPVGGRSSDSLTGCCCALYNCIGDLEFGDREVNTGYQ